jgi:hypothetical protein
MRDVEQKKAALEGRMEAGLQEMGDEVDSAEREHHTQVPLQPRYLAQC